MADELAAVVMAAGIGKRMKSATPKHLHPILGLIACAVIALAFLWFDRR